MMWVFIISLICGIVTSSEATSVNARFRVSTGNPPTEVNRDIDLKHHSNNLPESLSSDEEEYNGMIPKYGDDAEIMGDGEGGLLIGLIGYSGLALVAHYYLIMFLYNYFFAS